MTVIGNTTLLIRRLGELRRRRDVLVDRQDQLRGTLPEWALAPLQLVGMSAGEIQAMMNDLSEAERKAGLNEVERDIEILDHQIEELENMLLATPARGSRRWRLWELPHACHCPVVGVCLSMGLAIPLKASYWGRMFVLGILNNIAPSMRVKPRKGPPTPSDHAPVVVDIARQ